VPNYSRDWAEASGRETLLEACGRWLTPVMWAEARAGDVVVMRMARGAVAKHCGVLTGGGRFVHAREGIGVIEQDLGEFLRSVRTARVVGCFRFPEPGAGGA